MRINNNISNYYNIVVHFLWLANGHKRLLLMFISQNTKRPHKHIDIFA